ncbi:DUF5941 domain-containing protein [Plantactinospora sp. GCM10030261]|uniref:DUF5941 domain-containing protein n=1 Tax=Plantactinospora sp. GCM10030261 TaxID=3273420 RepID=UPI00361CD8E7
MTRAVLLTAGGTAASALVDGRPLADHLADQLRQAGATSVTVTDDLAEVARLATGSRAPLLLCADDVVAHTAVLRHLATSPVGPTVALLLPDPPPAGRPGIVEDRGRVVGAEAAGETTATFGGVIRVGVADLPTLAAAADGIAAGHDGAAARAVAGAAGHPPEHPVDRLFRALTTADLTIFTHRVRLLVARRAADPDAVRAAEAAVAAVPSEPAELRLAVKERDDFFTTYFVSSWSPWVTRLAARLGLGPTAVTVVSVLFAVVAAGLFAFGGRPALVIGALLLYLGFVLDCVDGQVARFTRNFSAWGGWLDTMADRAKEYVVYAGLAVGVERAGLGDGWPLAMAAITLQTVRHMTDTWYGVLHDEAVRRPAGAGAPGGLGARLSRASNRVQADTGSVTYWLKRTVVFPIGERWALIALAAALFDQRIALLAVLVWGGLAAAYTLALRAVRSRAMRVPVLGTVDTSLHRDDGPVARSLGAAARRLPGPLPGALLAVAASAALLVAALAEPEGARWWAALAALAVLAAALPAAGPHAGPLDWLVPAALRAAEYLFVIAAGVGGGVPPWLIYLALLALALHHYDLTARLEKRESAPALRSFGLGWDGRIILLTGTLLAGVPSVGFAVLAGYLIGVLLVGAGIGWTAAARTRRAAEWEAANDSLVSQRQQAG